MTAAAVEMRGISKRFGSVQALEGVSILVPAAGIHAIIGENGAGKTTLMRILYGALRPDEGTVLLNGRERRFRRASDAIRAGVGMVGQHSSVLPDLTCLQNLMLGAEPAQIIDMRSARARASELATQMGFDFDWDRRAEGLGPGAAQKLEILRLLWREAEILILDEPTAMLSPSDGEALFGSLRKLAREGSTILLVTHRLPEVMDHCDDVTVLRRGVKVAESPVAGTTAAALAELVVGRDLGSREPRVAAGLGDTVLEVRSLVVLGARGQRALQGIDLAVREGEIVGIAGVDGSGQRELVQALAGVLPPVSGTIRLDGAGARGGARGRIDAGVRLIPEDRQAEGLVEEWSLEENAMLGLQRVRPLARGPWIDRGARRRMAETVAQTFQTKHSGFDSPVRSLSGGNQQRFVAARALALAPRLLLAFQPARGLDVEGLRQVYDALRARCREGAGGLVVSFDLDELIEQCDRIVVMNRGKLFQPEPGKGKDRAAIGRLMVGAA